MSILASIIIRTYNEQRYLEELLQMIHSQIIDDFQNEVIIVDSGSNDNTIEIAEKFSCRIVHIDKSEFSFGRSLNVGCAAATGDYLVFISGHCIPTSKFWLLNLVKPLITDSVVLTYGRQLGGNSSKYSEKLLFEKFYPSTSKNPQTGFFCNNANSALLKNIWKSYLFNESLTGLEDMYLGKQLISAGMPIAYIAEAAVYHHHDESWQTIRRRYEREAIALQEIMPEVQINIIDFTRYLLTAIYFDSLNAMREKIFFHKFTEIFMFRLMQFWGSYYGNHEHRKLSTQLKEIYFYPRKLH
ncbi:MAG: glycosyltransferase family 2 protein [Aphanocapsa sp. GSE-SYN-MK-11-07L]|jgi:glycosyltransferase involved in cell wall biosynthesis|nr:glycosyltransferase family 2 protein [Aphanocapsa sp. GSE-SYN-MK-11-07L]